MIIELQCAILFNIPKQNSNLNSNIYLIYWNIQFKIYVGIAGIRKM